MGVRLVPFLLVFALLSGCTETDIDFEGTSTPPVITTTTAAATQAALAIDGADAIVSGTRVTVTWTILGPSDVQSRVEYGTTTAYGSNSGYQFGPGPKNVTVGPLEPSTNFHWHIHAIAGGKIYDTSDSVIRTQSAGDTLPPGLASVSVASIAHNSARVHWTVSEDSGEVTSWVKYGIGPGAHTLNSTKQDGTAAQQVQLTSLTTGTTYYFVVYAVDGSDNIATTVEKTFSTLAAPDTTNPTITGVTAGTPTSSSVAISWTVDDDSGGAESYVEYGPTSSYGSESEAEAGTGTQTVTLTGLVSSTTYHFRIRASDGSGLAASSSDQTFATSAAPTASTAPNPPPTLTGVGAGSITASTAMASWTVTDSTGTITSYVKWGTTPGTYTGTGSVQNNAGTQSYQITGLSASTTYFAKVFASDGTNPEVSSSEFSFPTSAGATPPSISNVVISQVKTDRFTVSWTVSGPSDVASYVVYGSGQSSPSKSGAGPQTETLLSLSEATSYSVRIRATASGFSNVDSTPMTQWTADLVDIDIVADSGSDSYSPDPVTGSSQTPILFRVENTRTFGHTLTFNNGAYDSDTIAGGATVTAASAVSFSAGTYGFFCELHPSMTGEMQLS